MARVHSLPLLDLRTKMAEKDYAPLIYEKESHNMSHLALYRRLRPKDFSEIIDQEHVVRILKNQLLGQTTSHAYLFCGTRGTGKTSMAKILAKALNCKERGDNPNPCSACESCMAAHENRNLNIIEIDAASNNGVDNVREIREEVKYPPGDGGVKVYIIDEVHMLSTGAFNALLKTLEEPPSRVVFILATTDAQKIPATILSRCVRLDFKRISIEGMTNTLRKVADEQSLAVTDAALKYIALTSDGAMRDAYSLLDQCISYYGGHIKDGEEVDVEHVLVLTGASDDGVFFDLMDAIAAFDSGRCLAIIEDIVVLGRDVGRFITDFTHHLRNLLISSSGDASVLNLSQAMQDRCLAQVKLVSSTRLIELIHEFCALSASLRYRNAFNERIMLECLCIKLCNPQSNEVQDMSALIARLERLENAPQATIAQPSQPMQAAASTLHETRKDEAVVTCAAPNADSQKPTASEAITSMDAPETTKDIITDWASFRNTFQEPLNGMLKDTRLIALGDGLCIVFANEALLPFAKLQQESISSAFTTKYSKDLLLTISSEAEYKALHGNDSINQQKEHNFQEKLGNIEIEWE